MTTKLATLAALTALALPAAAPASGGYLTKPRARAAAQNAVSRLFDSITNDPSANSTPTDYSVGDCSRIGRKVIDCSYTMTFGDDGIACDSLVRIRLLPGNSTRFSYPSDPNCYNA